VLLLLLLVTVSGGEWSPESACGDHDYFEDNQSRGYGVELEIDADAEEQPQQQPPPQQQQQFLLRRQHSDAVAHAKRNLFSLDHPR